MHRQEQESAFGHKCCIYDLQHGPAVYGTDLKGKKFEYWFTEGNLHREHGPAARHPGGTVEWYRMNGLHRLDGPAVVYPNGDETWWKGGQLHRGGGNPAWNLGGERRWYESGSLHSERGPAIDTSNGSESWYYKGMLHRNFGPAVINYIITNPEVLDRNTDGQTTVFMRIPPEVTRWCSGTSTWYQKRSTIIQYWYQDDKLHRIDGPAVIYSDITTPPHNMVRSELWYLRGQNKTSIGIERAKRCNSIRRPLSQSFLCSHRSNDRFIDT